jgi:hypothetical protein
MRKLVTTMTLAALLAGCDSSTEYGKCVGISESQRETRDPKLIYDVSWWNVFLGVIGVELIFPPLLVLSHELYCPIGTRPEKAAPQIHLHYNSPSPLPEGAIELPVRIKAPTGVILTPADMGER